MSSLCGQSVAQRGFHEMTTRRTPLRRKRLGDAAELEAWRSWFADGVAFDGDVMDLGLWQASSEDFERAGRQAWHRLGAAFLRTCNGKKPPWALERFGGPNGNEAHTT